MFYSSATVARRRKALGLMGSRTTTRETPETVRRQMVFDQMTKDPSRMRGPRTNVENILADTGLRFTR